MHQVLTEGGSATLQRVEWTEQRGDRGETDQYFLIAEIDRFGQLEVSERSEWEVCWYRVNPTPQMREKINQLFSSRALS